MGRRVRTGSSYILQLAKVPLPALLATQRGGESNNMGILGSHYAVGWNFNFSNDVFIVNSKPHQIPLLSHSLSLIRLFSFSRLLFVIQLGNILDAIFERSLQLFQLFVGRYSESGVTVFLYILRYLLATHSGGSFVRIGYSWR
jgi:hypothetical protein